MNFYTQQHRHYCGIDLHARSMYVCILDTAGSVLVHRNLSTTPEAFLQVVAPYREDLVIAVECMFTWYWLADLCAREGIAFVLGHALYMKAIHGGKAKNDKFDAHDIARFPRVQDFASYCRLVKCAKESAGKRLGSSGNKIGNAHLKWAFSEAAVLFLRQNLPGQRYFAKLERRHGKGKALTVLAHKLARAVSYMLTRARPFELERFVSAH